MILAPHNHAPMCAEKMAARLAEHLGFPVHVDPIRGPHRFGEVLFAVTADSEERRASVVGLMVYAGLPLRGLVEYPPVDDEPEYPEGAFVAYFGRVG